MFPEIEIHAVEKMKDGDGPGLAAARSMAVCHMCFRHNIPFPSLPGKAFAQIGILRIQKEALIEDGIMAQGAAAKHQSRAGGPSYLADFIMGNLRSRFPSKDFFQLF